MAQNYSVRCWIATDSSIVSLSLLTGQGTRWYPTGRRRGPAIERAFVVVLSFVVTLTRLQSEHGFGSRRDQASEAGKAGGSTQPDEGAYSLHHIGMIALTSNSLQTFRARRSQERRNRRQAHAARAR